MVLTAQCRQQDVDSTGQWTAAQQRAELSVAARSFWTGN
jgi:hypothetical protein